MEGSVTLLLQKGGKFYGKIPLFEQDLIGLNQVGNSTEDCGAPKDSETETKTPTTNLFMRTSNQTTPTPILNAGTEIKETMRNFVFKTGISPAQETKVWKCFSVSKEPEIISITKERNTIPILIEASPTQTARDFLESNKAILDIERIELYRLYTNNSQWVEDNMQLGEFGTEFTLEKAKYVIIQTPYEKFFEFFWDSELVIEFQHRIKKLQETSCKLVFYCCGCPLQGPQMRNTNVGEYSTVFSKPLLLGGGKSLKCDVDLSNASTIVGKGAKDGPEWLVYKEGLNILSKCSNTSCESINSCVVVQIGYPVLETILPGKLSYQCPACSDTKLSIVTFVVSNARAKFTFHKCSSNKVETVILESTTNDSGDYTLFMESDLKETGKTEYDYIEIATVKFGVSFNKCQLCNQTVRLDEEKIMPCGRAFHEKCLNLSKTCTVCSLSDYKLTDLNEIMASSSSSNDAVTLHLPNYEFGSCKSTEKAVPRYIGLGLITKLHKSAQGQSSESSLEVQQRFIVANLPALIRDTIVNTLVICHLRQREIISDEDEKTLDSIPKQTEKTRELYRIIGTRIGGILTLLDILKLSCQSGAVETLSGYIKEFGG